MTMDALQDQAESYPARDRFYMMIFSAQRAWNRPKYTHTFATFVRAKIGGRGQGTGVSAGGEDSAGDSSLTPDPRPLNPYLETHTISWLAANKRVRLLRLWP